MRQRTVPGTKSIMLTFDDFLVGMEQCGQLPLPIRYWQNQILDKQGSSARGLIGLGLNGSQQ